MDVQQDGETAFKKTAFTPLFGSLLRERGSLKSLRTVSCPSFKKQDILSLHKDIRSIAAIANEAPYLVVLQQLRTLLLEAGGDQILIHSKLLSIQVNCLRDFKALQLQKTDSKALSGMLFSTGCWTSIIRCLTHGKIGCKPSRFGLRSEAKPVQLDIVLGLEDHDRVDGVRT